MASDMELEAESSALLLIDVQERLASSMPETRMLAMARAARILFGAARELSVQALYSEQYPKGLGPTLPDIAREFAGAERLEKLEFSAAAVVAPALKPSVKSVVLLGMEAHVCVCLTARDLAAQGLIVHVAADGVASRRDDHRELGLGLCARAGAIISSSETIVFDWMKRAGSDVFRRISALVRPLT